MGERRRLQKGNPCHSDGIASADVEGMHPGTMTLEERLSELAESARQALIRAANDDAPFEVIHERSTAVEEVRALITTARSFLMDIEDELLKGPQSALRVDDEATRRTGITHINLRSVDKWIAATHRRPVAEGVSPVAHDPVAASGPGKRSKREESVYVTLALAVIAFARKAKGKYVRHGVDAGKASNDSDLNMSAVHEHLAEIAASLVESGQFPEQSVSSIKLRLREAFEAKRRALTQ
jgi:hypothetical protein